MLPSMWPSFHSSWLRTSTSTAFLAATFFLTNSSESLVCSIEWRAAAPGARAIKMARQGVRMSGAMMVPGSRVGGGFYFMILNGRRQPGECHVGAKPHARENPSPSPSLQGREIAHNGAMAILGAHESIAGGY